MDLGLKDKLALVTASSRGLGYACAKALLEEGAKVIISSRNLDRLREAYSKLKGIGGEVYYHVVDLRVKESIDSLFNWVKESFGKLDILVYSTGGPRPGKFMELSWDDWVEASRLLALSAVWVARRSAELMLPQRWGRMVFIASVTIKEPWEDLALSNIMRLPVAGIVRTLARELGPHGITVNAVLPSIVLTDRVRQIAYERARKRGVSVDEVLDEMAKSIPVKRLGRPEELGWLVAFLVSEKAGFINGAIIPFDGGFLRSTL